MSNITQNKISEFLFQYFPFSLLESNDLENITKEITVKYINKNDIIFNSKDNLIDVFFVVASGSVGLYATSNTSELLVDQCYQGTNFGLRPHFAENNYQLKAKAQEDCILYCIPFEYFYQIIVNKTEVLKYLLKSFASNKRNPNNSITPGFLVSQNVLNSIHRNTFDYFQQIKYNKNICIASPLSTLDEIINLMNINNLGCVIIEENNQPVGIITDKDIINNCDKILNNKKILAKELMVAPVITANENISLSEAQLFFVQNPIQYICITKNGSTDSKSIGLISIHEVIAAAVDNPNLIIQQIKSAKNTLELKEIRIKINQFIDNTANLKIPILHTSKIIGEFNDALVYQVIKLVLEKQETSPPTLFAWFSMGSMARHEQILLTDQNSGLIFEYNKEQDRNYTEIRNYFVDFANKIVTSLHTIGYNYCDENIMANKLKCCKSLMEWNKMYESWIVNTKEFQTEINPIFFDTHFIYGDVNMYNQLILNTKTDFSKEDLFLSFLAKESLKFPSPLSFFKQFNVDENNGNEEFNIKIRAIQPFTEAARVLTLKINHLEINNTVERFYKLIIEDEKNKFLYEDCIDAFLILQEFRTEEGLKNQNNGNFIDLKFLSKQDQNKLKQCFEPLQNIQEFVKDKFNFNYFN